MIVIVRDESTGTIHAIQGSAPGWTLCDEWVPPSPQVSGETADCPGCQDALCPGYQDALNVRQADANS